MKNQIWFGIGLLLSSLALFPVASKSIAQEKAASTSDTQADSTKNSAAENEQQSGWIDLLSSDLFAKNWSVTKYGGEGPVDFKAGLLTLKSGMPLTGVHWTADFPKEDYEVRFKAQRLSGFDFLACLTFPVGDQFCSAVVGGWGGATLGISNINGSDASENEWSRTMSFENEKWYSFHLKVTKDKIQFAVDNETMIDVPRKGNQFDTRIEVIRSRPFGLCNYQCVTQIKDFAYRPITQPNSSVATNTVSEIPKFLRVTFDEQQVMEAVQTAIATYTIPEGEFAGAKIDLVGAIHVGEKTYYEELNERFKGYDTVLYELVADPGVKIEGRKDEAGVVNPLSSMQVAMKESLALDFQLDEIDYTAKNFVHADMSPAEFMEDMRKRKDSFLSMFARAVGSSIAAQATSGGQDTEILSALMQPDQKVALRCAFAKQFINPELQMAGIGDANGLSTLVTERNAKAMSVLRQELKAGKKNLAIFYGAAHLDDMHLKLLRDFNAKFTGSAWLTAWNLK